MLSDTFDALQLVTPGARQISGYIQASPVTGFVIIERLASIYVFGEAMPDSNLLSAVRDGNEAEVSLLLDSRADVHTRGENGQTPLLLAAKWSHQEIVRLLLGNGADIESSDNNGFTALLLASKCGHKEVVH